MVGDASQAMMLLAVLFIILMVTFCESVSSSHEVSTCHASEFSCDAGHECVHWSARCEFAGYKYNYVGYNQCFDGSDDKDCVCGIHHIALSQNEMINISSPNYPRFYYDNQRCTWIFTAILTNGSIALRMVEINLYRRGEDWLVVGRGTDQLDEESQLLRVKHLLPRDTLISVDESSLWISFTSNLAQRQKGFVIQVTSQSAFASCGRGDYIFCNDGTLCYNGMLVCTSCGNCSQKIQEINACIQCSNEDFWCSTPYGFGCVNQSQVCDGSMQCIDGSDEFHCHVCDEKWINMINDDITYLTSPGYPGRYHPSAKCTWYFTASEDKGTFIAKFLDLYLITYDVISIGETHHVALNTTVIQLYLWFAPVAVMVTQRRMWIHFEANEDYVIYLGFMLSVERVQEQGILCQDWEYRCESTDVCLDQSLVCNALAECWDGSDEKDCYFCGPSNVTLNANESRSIQTLPTFPNFYPRNLKCYWHIMAREGHFITILFQYFDVATAQDYLFIGYSDTISDDTTVIRVTGSSKPNSITLNSTSAWMYFNAPSGFWWGFVLSVTTSSTSVACNEDEYLCESGYGCLDKTLLCDNVPQCLHGSDEHNCDICGVREYLLTPFDTFTLTSPGFPELYPISTACTWSIYVNEDDGSMPMITFKHFNTDRNFDFLQISADNGTLLSLSGFIAPSSIVVNSTYVDVSFSTYLYNDHYDGFHLELSLASMNVTCNINEFTCKNSTSALICLHSYHRCDGKVLCPDESDERDCGICGTRFANLGSDAEIIELKSPGYPMAYPSDLICMWYVSSLIHRRVLVNIAVFSMEDGYDFLYFGNGDLSLKETQIVQLTGLVKVQRIASSANKMWILMTADRTKQLTGFALEIKQAATAEDICTLDEFDCGNGICVAASAECDGFNDCVNWAEENKCAYVTCPSAYLCDESDTLNVTMCLSMHKVCDGSRNCIQGDDETECDIKRCPDDCLCSYLTATNLVVECPQGLTVDILEDVPPISNTLNLTGGDLSTPEPGIFKALTKLKALSLAHNRINYLPPRVFDGLDKLIWLDLSFNNFTMLTTNVFAELHLLRELFIFNVPLHRITNGAFNGVLKLKTLILIRTEKLDDTLVIESNAFRDLRDLQNLFCDFHTLCCYFDKLDQCTTLEPVPPLFNCGSLMQNNVLRIAMWVLGFSALIGNVFVFTFRIMEESPSTTHYKQRIFIASLAFSDFLMGVYMIILASADVYYGEEYFTQSSQWRSGLVCKMAGFIGLFSSEASVFFISLITIDRFVCILFPFSEYKLRKRSSQTAVLFLWLFSVVIALVPILLAGPESDFYDLSDVCMGLPLITRPSSYSFQASNVTNQVTFDLPVADDSKPAWYFSIAIFLVLNLVCFVIICACYTAIFITVKVSSKMVGRSEKAQEDIKLAAKMAAVVGTDFLCWFPVIVMGILSQTGAVVIPLDAYVWSVVFILPVNSSLNPYLYTIASLLSDSRDGKMRKPKHKKTVSLATSMSYDGGSISSKL